MSDETPKPMPEDQRPSQEPLGDERVGELLRRHAGLYHDPPETPREAMWARIEAARGRTGGEADGGDAGRVLPFAPPARRRWWLGTIAAAAVLALGIVLGRISMRDEAERQGAGGPPVANVESPAAREPETGARREPIAAPGAEDAPPAQVAAGPEAVTDVAPEAVPRRIAPERVVPRELAQAPRVAQPEAGTPATASPRDLYRLASQQMLGQAEALLVQYRSDRAADRIDPAVGRWARDVLSSTRLLLDSPAAEDPKMRDLLEDLELVLAQIVQRTGEADPLNDEMIDRTIEDRDLMPRLRGAIPAGVGAI